MIRALLPLALAGAAALAPATPALAAAPTGGVSISAAPGAGWSARTEDGRRIVGRGGTTFVVARPGSPVTVYGWATCTGRDGVSHKAWNGGLIIGHRDAVCTA